MYRISLCAFLCGIVASPAADALDSSREDVQTFIAEMARDHGLDATELTTLFAGVTSRKSILDAMSRPAERVTPWYEYRQQFLVERRIRRGEDFWQQHHATLARLAAQGAPVEIILGILGVETIYGEITGKFRVIDALSTLAFDYPPRSPYFRSELIQFLLLSNEETIDPRSAMGSYAGAMGAPQFMPRSYREFAVDGDGDGRRDLWSNWDDVLASINNYLRAHGWRNGEPVLAEATLEDPDLGRFDIATLALNETVGSLRAKGVKFDTVMPESAPALLIVAQGKDGPVYRVGFNNFYVVTRYNRSIMYAMAVHDLGAAISARRQDAERTDG